MYEAGMIKMKMKPSYFVFIINRLMKINFNQIICFSRC